MKLPVFVLAFALAGVAQAQTQESTLCYGWLSNTPAEAVTLIQPVVEAALRSEDPKPSSTQRRRVQRCMVGAVQEIHPLVRAYCADNAEVGALISDRLSLAYGTCLAESGAPANVLIPAFGEDEGEESSARSIRKKR